MQAWLTLFLIFTIFATAFGKNNFPNEVLLTSADVVNGKIQNIGKAGESYRLYAVYAAGSDDALVKQVTISDSAGIVLNLNELCGKVGSYFLAENNIVVGPVTVLDPTTQTQTRKRSVSFQLTYTIYLVSTRVPALPVADSLVSALRLSVQSDDYNGKETSGITILSAEPFFSLRQFKFTSDSVYIIPRGYDAVSSGIKDSVLDLTLQNAYSSFITIFGPIATIFNKDQSKTGQFNIGFDIVSTFGPADGLETGSSLTLLSPNWLSPDDSYSTSYRSYNEALGRQFYYVEETQIDFSLSAYGLKEGESVSVKITKSAYETPKEWTYTPSAQGEIRDSAPGLSLNLRANVASLASPETYPRFILKVTSSGIVPSTTPPMESTTSGGEGASASAIFACLLFMFMILSL